MEVKNLGMESSLPEEEKDMLDLNKVPSKSDSSSSVAAGSDYFSALENAGNSISESSVLVCNNNADSRDDVVASDLKDDAGDNEKRGGLIFPNSDTSHERMDKSPPSKGCEEDAGDQCGSSDDDQVKANDAPKKRRGRKKKVFYSPQVKVTKLNSEKGNEARKETRGRKRKVVVTTSSDKDLETMSEELIHVEPRKETRGRKRMLAVTATSCDKDLETMSEELVHLEPRRETRGRKKKVSVTTYKEIETTSEELIHVEPRKETRGCKKEVALTISCDKDLETMSEELIRVEPRKETRGRKKKVLKSESCNNQKELTLRAASEEKSSCLESNESNVAESSEDVDAGHNAKECVQKFGTRRRGRKRKMKVQLGESEDDEIIDKKAVTSVPADKSGTAARVLRSRTRVEADNEILAHAKGNGGLERIESEEKDQSSDKEDIDMKMHRSALIKQGMRNTKKRLGRPPKLQNEEGNPNVYVERRGRPPKLQNEEGNPNVYVERRGRPPKLHKEKGSLNVYVERRGRPRKLHKENGNLNVYVERRGRPRKVHKEHGDSKVCVKKKIKLGTQAFINKPKTTDCSNSLNVQTRNTSSAQVDSEKEKTEDCKESNNKLAAESEKCASDRCQSYPEGGPHHSELDESESKNNKNGELRRSEAKQLVRDEIVSILKNAGWTIEYRPRMSKDYLDSVYVDCEGRGYWSVTLAYKQLRDRVENGTADSKAVAAFIPIPEEKLRTLFRITTGKRGEAKKKEKVNKEKAYKDEKKKEKVNKAGKKIVNEGLKRKRGRPKLNRRTETKKRCALLVRRSENGSGPSSDGFILYEGKRTLLSWMLDSGTLPLGAKILLTKGTKENVILEGKISREGICCGCCDADVTLSVFQSHAGCKHDQPFDSIYLDSGSSLSQCLTDAWRKHAETIHIGFHSLDVDGDDPNDDTCNLCGDGGDLICCDGCPSTFHQSCLQIQSFPSGDWRCVYCSCKFCEMIDRPCLGDDVEDTDDYSLLTCLLCEEKFHIACIKGKDDIHNTKESILFCGQECQKIFERLQKLLGVRHELEDGFSWTFLRCQDVDCNENSSPDSAKVLCNSKLTLAFSVMDECFSPIMDPRSQTNMIERVVFNCGSNFRRLNYSGFCTAILERGEELVAAASIRIHGNQLAEMPFIGTRYMYRRQGMCRRLLSAIETALFSIDVKKLVIPAVPALIETWTNVFGFAPLEDSSKQAMKYMSMAVFPGTDMLQKPVCKHETIAVNVTCASETSNGVAPLKDDKIQDVGAPQSSITPPNHPSEVDMQQLPVAPPQCDSGTVLSDDKEISKCKLELNRDCDVECKSDDDKEIPKCELELSRDCDVECKSDDDKEIPKCELELNRDCGVECRSVAGTVPEPREEVLVDETLHAAEEEKGALTT